MSVQLIRADFEQIDLKNLGQIDLVFADPPDNMGLDYDGYKDNMPDDEYETLLSCWLRTCCQVTAGPVFFTFSERWTFTVEETIRRHELRLIQRCYWHFTFGQNSQKKYTPSIRPVYWLNNPVIYPHAIKVPSARQAKYEDKRAKAGGRVPDNLTRVEIDPEDPVWNFSRVCGTFKEKRHWHVCQIPEDLLRRVILGHSLPDQTVLDPFIGSGTTAYVCQTLNRHCVGIDQSQFYLDEIAAELDHRAQKEDIA